MKKPIILIVLFLIIGSVLYAYKMYNKPHTDVVTTDAAETVSAEDIIETAKKFNDFVTNGESFAQFKEVGQKMYEEGLKNSKPFADAYQNTVKAFFPNLKNGK